MACFEMSLPRSKRIRSISAEGHEDFVSDEDLPLLQAAQLAKQVSVSGRFSALQQVLASRSGMSCCYVSLKAGASNHLRLPFC